jgi:hypothetical protein
MVMTIPMVMTVLAVPTVVMTVRGTVAVSIA